MSLSHSLFLQWYAINSIGIMDNRNTSWWVTVLALRERSGFTIYLIPRTKMLLKAYSQSVKTVFLIKLAKKHHFLHYSLLLLRWFPITFETMNPTTKPIAMISGISMIWDIPNFQKNRRKVTTWVFWISMITKRAIKTTIIMVFVFIILHLSHYSFLFLLRWVLPAPFLLSNKIPLL